MKLQTIDIQAKEWFDKVNGNSYFAALVTLNFGMADEKEIKIPFQYGYGEQYLTETKHQLQTDGVLPEGTIYNMAEWCQENNIILRHNKRKNCLKRELNNI